MKIYINREYVAGPWGGGAKPLGKLIDLLRDRGHEVYFDLRNQKYDVYICWDPRPNSSGVWYGTINDHRQKFGGKIIQRVGDVGTHGKPDLTNLVKCSTVYSDHVIFVSDWAYDYIGREILNKENVSVIRNGSLQNFFNFRNTNFNVPKKLSVVTHHWSNNEKKGFDIYRKIDQLIEDKMLDIDFTYIGRLPDDFRYKNIKYVTPKDVEFLSKHLPEYNVYLTASREEAGANHVLEAMAAGLPVIYHAEGGSIPEYCREYSNYQFNSWEELPNITEKLRENYHSAKLKSLKYERTADDSIKKYIEIIEAAK